VGASGAEAQDKPNGAGARTLIKDQKYLKYFEIAVKKQVFSVSH
jgi:hypothetical protein